MGRCRVGVGGAGAADGDLIYGGAGGRLAWVRQVGVGEVVEGSQASIITSSRGDPGEDGVGRGDSWRGGSMSPSS